MALTSREIVAAEAHYHRSCYREYTRPKKQGLGCDISDDTQDIDFDAFSDLFEHIIAEVLEKRRVIPMTEVTNQFELFARQRGIEKVREMAKKHIKRKTAAEFGTTLVIFRSSRGKLIAVPANLSLKETVEAKLELEKEVDILCQNTQDADKIVDKCFTHTRGELLKNKWSSQWPIHPFDVKEEQFDVPGCLKRLLTGIITGDPVPPPSVRVQSLVKSFSQDIVYAVTNGKIKPPKQVLLSYGVKTLTGDVQLMQILNRLGHGVSYA